MVSRSIVPATLSFVLFIGCSTLAFAANDVVVTTSGDRLVGEIKKVDKDILTLSTDYSDTDFKIKWEKIASIQSDRQFLVETFNGQRLTGKLQQDPDKKQAVQVEATSVPLPDVSAVQPFERTFWSRFDSAVDFGYSSTQANAAKQLTLSGNLTYRDAETSTAYWATSFEARSRTRQRQNDGISGTTSGTCSAASGTSARRRTS